MSYFFVFNQRRHFPAATQRNMLLLHMFVVVGTLLRSTRAASNLQNIAINKPTNQSSTFSSHYRSDHAVDGNRNPFSSEGSCSSSTTDGSDLRPYWFVSLEDECSVDEVVVYNRRDCCSDRLTGIKVYLGKNAPVTWASDLNKEVFCGERTQSTDGVSKVTISCDNKKGRFVSILKPTPILTLCELEIFGKCSAGELFPVLYFFGD